VPVTMKNAVPMWASLLILIAVVAIAGYFIITHRS
jgi:hypothetical protein